MKKQAQETYSTLVSGFDAEIVFGEEGQTVDVELFEAGAPVWDTQIDLTPFLNEEGDTFTEDLISAAAQAAVDLFESERETLGQGAEALTVEGSNMRKHSYYVVLEWEDWYMSFKGTVFQEQATELLESLLDLGAVTEQSNRAELNAAYEEQCALEYEMGKLFFEKMKTDPGGGQTVIVINAGKQAFYGIHQLEDWLAKFMGHRLEPQAVAYAQEYLDLSAKIENLNASENDTWETENELRFAMEELKLQLLQANLDQMLPDEGPDVAPELMNDLFELAEGVEFDEPLVPFSDVPVSMYEEPIDDTQAFGEELAFTATKKQAEADEVTDQEPVEVQEMGQLADGLQIAEIPVDDQPFNSSERIELSKEFKQVLWGGITKKLPKGMKGKVESLWDQAGDFYLVRFDDGRLVKIPYTHLKRLKKGG